MRGILMQTEGSSTVHQRAASPDAKNTTATSLKLARASNRRVSLSGSTSITFPPMHLLIGVIMNSRQEPAVETERAEAKRTSLVDRQLPWTKSSSRCTA
jgi:hypothetical protein